MGVLADNLELNFRGIVDDATVACFRFFSHASVARARTARNPSPASSGEA
jgi:hypothetical protein